MRVAKLSVERFEALGRTRHDVHVGANQLSLSHADVGDFSNSYRDAHRHAPH